MRHLLSFILLFLSVTPSFYSASPIKTVEWRELSDRTLTDLGQRALGVYGDAWQHAETEHFVYHFHDPKEAQTVLVHAEAYYGWVKQLFGVREDKQKRKSHVFVFEDREVWKSFNARSPEKLPGAEAFTNGFELFLYREPFYLEPQRVLAHEITHLVLFRFVKGSVPLFLNEGFAEFMATKAIAMKAGGDDYSVRTFQPIAPQDFIPVKELAAMTGYPAGRETAYYRQSELLARFLILNHGSEKFYELLNRTAGGEAFEKAVQAVYGMDPKAFSDRFKAYAGTR